KSVLSDTVPHLTAQVGSRAGVGQPSVGRKKFRESRTKCFNAVRISRDGLSDSPCFVDQFTNFRIIDQKTKSLGIVIVVTEVTHEKPPLALCGNFLRLLPENTAVRRGGHRCGGGAKTHAPASLAMA